MNANWKKGKRIVFWLGILCFIAAWAAVVVGYFMRVSVPVWVVLVTIAAFASEGLIWLFALSMGLKIVEARQKIWSWLKGPFRARKNSSASSSTSPNDHVEDAKAGSADRVT